MVEERPTGRCEGVHSGRCTEKQGRMETRRKRAWEEEIAGERVRPRRLDEGYRVRNEGDNTEKDAWKNM